jgi:hypothetical protein
MRLALALLSLLLLAATPLSSPWPTPETTDTAVSPEGNQPGKQAQGATETRPTTQKHQAAANGYGESAQNDQGGEMLELSRRLTKYTGKLADYTWLLVIIGFLQFVGAALQVAWLISAHKLSRQLFVITHRPLVHVRSVTPEDRIIPQSANFNLFFTIVNRGGTPAKIIGSNLTIWFDFNERMPTNRMATSGRIAPYEEEAERVIKVPNDTLEPGVAYHFTKVRESPPAMAAQWWSGKLYMFILGYITYKDAFGLLHETAFCRRWNRKSMLFETVYHPDYEYQE